MIAQDIRREYERLSALVSPLPAALRKIKAIDGISIDDLIAYQIGWGSCLIRWYEAGIKGETPEMPGEGFTKWDYKAIARHFYIKYNEASTQERDEMFRQIAMRIIDIAEKEHQFGRLDKTGVWPWCTLPSGKEWTLGKWIRVNTFAPYRRAYSLIKKYLNLRSGH
jgi:hypothetical protein